MTPNDRRTVERSIAVALRAAIKEHGPITPERIGSAAKRVYGQLVSEALLKD